MINRVPWWDLLFLTVLASAGITAWQRGLAGYLRAASSWFVNFAAGCGAAYFFGWYCLLPLFPVFARVGRADSVQAAMFLVVKEGVKSGLGTLGSVVRGLKAGSVDGAQAFVALLVGLAGWCVAWTAVVLGVLRRRTRGPGLLERLEARVPKPWDRVLATAWAVGVRLAAVGVFVVLSGSFLSGLGLLFPPEAPIMQLAGNLRRLICGSALGRLGVWFLRAVLEVFV